MGNTYICISELELSCRVAVLFVDTVRSKKITYEQFHEFCGSLPGTSYVCQWGGAHVWKVGGKVFAIGGWEKFETPAYTFKTSEADFFFLQDEAGFRAAPYMASRGMKWIQQYDGSEVTDGELKNYLKESHRIVSMGLTKKKQKELGIL